MASFTLAKGLIREGMINRLKAAALLYGFLITVTACSGKLSESNSVNKDPVDAAVSTIGINPTSVVCDLSPIEGVIFPRQEPVDAPREVMEAELVGELVLQDGCLRIKSCPCVDSYTPVWPPEFNISLEDGGIVVVDGKGVIVGRVGEEIYMGGGTGSENALPGCVKETVAEKCGGPYWIVGEGVRLNLKYDSTLFNLDLLPVADRTAIFLQKDAILDNWIDEPGTITGALRFYIPDRCPRIQSESGIRDFLLIWPPGYTLQETDGSITILDTNDRVIVKQDEIVTLMGGPIPNQWENERYRVLRSELPGDCHGPYWIVRE